jgi:hypothetical protein
LNVDIWKVNLLPNQKEVDMIRILQITVYSFISKIPVFKILTIML